MVQAAFCRIESGFDCGIYRWSINCFFRPSNIGLNLLIQEVIFLGCQFTDYILPIDKTVFCTILRLTAQNETSVINKDIQILSSVISALARIVSKRCIVDAVFIEQVLPINHIHTNDTAGQSLSSGIDHSCGIFTQNNVPLFVAIRCADIVEHHKISAEQKPGVLAFYIDRPAVGSVGHVVGNTTAINSDDAIILIIDRAPQLRGVRHNAAAVDGQGPFSIRCTLDVECAAVLSSSIGADGSVHKRRICAGSYRYSTAILRRVATKCAVIGRKVAIIRNTKRSALIAGRIV